MSNYLNILGKRESERERKGGRENKAKIAYFQYFLLF